LEAEWKLFKSGSRFELGELSVNPFSVPHDAADPVGFVLASGNSSFGVLTDLGSATRQITNAVQGVSALLVESNHDESLLQNDTKRPWSVKQRILSRHGHLSNQAAADLVASAASPSLRHIALAHLSADCNTPELARTAVREKLESTGIPLPEIHCPGTPESPLPLVFEI
jgi:phosphoribosyl 1,2-cyclic phosphodiesterase